jgi:uncharacterized protein (DUF2252 family)
MNFAKATRKYETWMAGQVSLVPADLREKHKVMRRDPFVFFRGTFYRWAQQWPQVCRDVADAPVVTAVGDLHVENFGTWRDAEGRLAWGINDFDECAPLPYTNDLVRLMASAMLAARRAKIHLPAPVICRAVLEGYFASLTGGGIPVVFDGQHRALHHAVTAKRKPPSQFWKALKKLRPLARTLDRRARKALLAALPEGASDIRFKRRTAGVGSLGRPRIVALASSDGSLVAREAKASLPSAAVWAGTARRQSDPEEVMRAAVRSHDPTLTFRRRWTVRRLSPECSKIDLVELPRDRDERHLLAAMGVEAANVHLGDPRAATRILSDLRRRSPKAFLRAAGDMLDAMRHDWLEFRR